MSVRSRASGPAGNIVLIGFMGSGKSEVGRRLAALTGRHFIDTDELVEAGGLSIADIFASEGENGFRRREREAVARAARSKGAVVATGGGAVLTSDNVKALKRSGVLVYLQTGPDELTKRLEESRGRPLIDRPEEGPQERSRRRRRIRELLADRLPVYEATADVVIPTQGSDPDHIARDVLRRLDVLGESSAMVGRVTVPLSPQYHVMVGRRLLSRAAALLPIPAAAEKAGIVSHPRVSRLWGDTLERGLRGTKLRIVRVNFPEGEDRKTLDTAGRLYRRLAAHEFHRPDVLIALGGGVVGDLTGFVASTYARGLACVQVPTTLLAMVDASVGGKTGFNLPEAKNLVGTFHQPIAVLADLDTVRTLSERELRGGLAEVAKYAMIADPSLGELLAERRDEVMAREDVLEEIVLRSATIKAEVVASDERDAGRRVILNYGHTLGHALEALGLAGRLQIGRGPGVHHGEAIAVGMVFSAWVSVVCGLAGKDLVEEHVRLLEQLGLPTSVGRVSWEDVRRYVGIDKKYAQGLRLVLLEAVGRPVVLGDIPQQALAEALSHVTEA